ncbi:MAG TPA: hypothetical protein VGE52_10655, partial [Pirellulales bacterium]
RSMQLVQGDFETRMRRRIAEFLEARREWNLRLYRTPAGLRVLVTHKTFAPDDPAVAECFAALGADPLYVRMCLNQHCFRARVSPKPWRIGVSDHIPPGRGTWPIRPEIAEDRADWVEKYEAEATRFAACRFLESTGSGVVHHQVRWVQELHDDLCYATSGLPIA